jgi:prepilin-type N-terminal cleavage/methylation domain-containing protein
MGRGFAFSRQEPCAGFTLLEALVALTIVGIALGVLFQVVSGSLNLGFRSREQFVITAEAMAVFDMVAPQSPVWEDLEWSNSTELGEWTMTLHPVIMRDSFERTSIVGGRDLFKLVFTYRDLGTGRKVRLFSYRREEQDRLRAFLEENSEHVVWDEYDQFAEYITP